MPTRRQTLQLMASAAALAAVPSMARSVTNDLYDRSLVIDGLCFGKEWGEDVFTALGKACLLYTSDAADDDRIV